MLNETSSSCEIRNFTEFLEKCLGRKVHDYTLRPLTKPGENYGSTMQSVDVKLTDKKCSKVSSLDFALLKKRRTEHF